MSNVYRLLLSDEYQVYKQDYVHRVTRSGVRYNKISTRKKGNHQMLHSTHQSILPQHRTQSSSIIRAIYSKNQQTLPPLCLALPPLAI
eukprot:scaffold17423_cov52-Cyclotella_meneghiniana.AAC.4